jgi:hypothetical protein
LNDKINRVWYDFIKNGNTSKMKEELVNELYLKLRKLDLLESQLDIYNNKNIMLNLNGKLINNPEELLNAVRVVVMIANKLDDEVIEEFGGKRVVDL